MTKKIKTESLESFDVSADVESGNKKIKLHFNVLALVILIVSIVASLIVLNYFGILEYIIKVIQ